MTEEVLRFRANMRRLAPKSALGYRLFSHLLSIWFPLPGRTLRFDGSFSSNTYFALDPVEPPRVPLEERYQLGFVFAQELFLYAGPPYTHVLVTFPQAMSHGRMLAPFLKQLDHAAGIHPRTLPQPQPRKRPVEVRLLTEQPPPWTPPFIPSEHPNRRTNEDDHD